MELMEAYGRILLVSLLRYFILAGIPFLLFYKLIWKKYLKAKIQDKIASYQDFKREMFQSIQATLIIALVALVFTKTPLVEYTLIYKNMGDYPFFWMPISVVLALVLHDTYFYWMHRALHSKLLYKLAHKTHHLSINPSPWASYSFHTIESVTEALILPLLIFTIPMHPIAILAFATASFFINVYGHLGFEIAPLWLRNTWLFEVLNTSVHHNLHHSKFKGNYGLYFRVWDRLMGTEHPDYVKSYDAIQQKRLAADRSLINSIYPSIIKKGGVKPPIK